jgi:hypothetical protein
MLCKHISRQYNTIPGLSIIPQPNSALASSPVSAIPVYQSPEIMPRTGTSGSKDVLELAILAFNVGQPSLLARALTLGLEYQDDMQTLA